MAILGEILILSLIKTLHTLYIRALFSFILRQMEPNRRNMLKKKNFTKTCLNLIAIYRFGDRKKRIYDLFSLKVSFSTWTLPLPYDLPSWKTSHLHWLHQSHTRLWQFGNSLYNKKKQTLKTRNTVSNAHKMISPAPPCFVWQSPCFALGNPKIIQIKT